MKELNYLTKENAELLFIELLFCPLQQNKPSVFIIGTESSPKV